jgi:hypothetical protein
MPAIARPAVPAFFRAPLSLAAAAGLSICGQAAAQNCSWRITDIPDFDQRRYGLSSVGGLPGDGNMYCVPTSAIDWMAYFANRGIPQPLGLAGPRDWQSQDEYVRVGQAIGLMGDLMETTAAEGTYGGPGLDGLSDYLGIYAQGDITASYMGFWSGNGAFLNPGALRMLQLSGAYLMGGYGRYTSTTGGTRDGGHCFAIQGIWDSACGPSAPIMLEFRDPAHAHDDPFPATSNQSAFHTNLAVMTPVSGLFRPDPDELYEFVSLYRLDTTGSERNFLDNVFALWPAAGLISDPGRVPSLRIVRPVRPTGNPLPAQQTLTLPSGIVAIKGLAQAPDQTHYYYSADGSAGVVSGVWKVNALTGVSTRILSLTGGTAAIPAGPIAISRNGDLYMIVGNTVRRYDLADPGAGVLSTLTNISPPPQNIAFDDKNDTVVIITADPTIGGRRVLRWGRTLPSIGLTYDLAVTVDGIPCVQPDAETPGAYFVCGSESGILYRVIAQNGDLVEDDRISHLGSNLTGLNVTDANSLVYAVNGLLVERIRNANGVWVPRTNSRWANRAAEGAVAITRSRSNHLPVETGPTFNNLANPTVYPMMPSCFANCDLSTTAPVLNVADFTCFLQKFAAGHPYANCDNSTTPPALNVADFTCYLQRYATGCP